MAKLVPTFPSEFNQSIYWESFFKKRTRAFEWYGNYYELCGVLHKYIKPSDQVLMAGCGNSELSENMYDAGLKKIVNIDISQTVIDQMNRRKGNRTTLEYVKMDLAALTFDSETFSVIVDKGTLDAVMSDDSIDSHETADKIFAEYARVLKNGGRYICVTLAQDFILRRVTDFFSAPGWLLRLHMIPTSSEDKGSELPVFAFVITKFQALPKTILEICPGDGLAPRRVDNVESIVDFIKSQQQFSALKSHLKREINSERENLDIKLYSPDNSDHPRFTLNVVDKAGHSLHCKFAVFIVPQGRENDAVYCSREGRLQIINQTPFQRLLFVSMHPAHDYGSRQSVQEELNATVMDFAPPGMKQGSPVPYLSSSSDDYGERRVQCKGESATTGPYLVADYRGDGGAWFRHLLFLKRENLIQCEIRLRQQVDHTKNHRSKKKCSDDCGKLVPDVNYLASQYAEAIIAGLTLRHQPQTPFKVMVVGVGGGTLSTFILRNFEKSHVTGVELDEALILIGHDWFGLPTPESEPRLQICIEDGLKFVHAERSKVEKQRETGEATSLLYDVIIIDADAKDPSLGISFPPVEFLEEEFLRATSEILSEDGLLMVNLACKNASLKADAYEKFKKVYKFIAKFKCDSYSNELIYCFKQRPTVDLSNHMINSRSGKKKNKRKKAGKKRNDVHAKSMSPVAEGDVINGDANDITKKLNSARICETSDDTNAEDKQNDSLPEEGKNNVTTMQIPLNSFEDSNLYNLWAGNASLWEKEVMTRQGSKFIRLSDIVDGIVIVHDSSS